MKLKHIAASLVTAIAFIAIPPSLHAAETKSPAKTGLKPYKLKTCIVTDNDLGSMGDVQRLVYNGQEIKFCCTPCVQKFQKNPKKYLSKLS